MQSQISCGQSEFVEGLGWVRLKLARRVVDSSRSSRAEKCSLSAPHYFRLSNRLNGFDIHELENYLVAHFVTQFIEKSAP